MFRKPLPTNIFVLYDVVVITHPVAACICSRIVFWIAMSLWVKKGYPKNLIGKRKIDQNLWSLGVFFLTHCHVM